VGLFVCVCVCVRVCVCVCSRISSDGHINLLEYNIFVNVMVACLDKTEFLCSTTYSFAGPSGRAV
jgi:hypothetical protein